jgi:hypothetical protein
MEETFVRIIENLGARVTGPMQFRVVIQPLMATIFAVIAGLKDAKGGRPAYFWALFTQREERRLMMADGWKKVGKIFALAVVLDVVYQLIVQGFVFPFEVLVVAFILAIVPYLIIRGPVNRIASLISKRGH